MRDGCASDLCAPYTRSLPSNRINMSILQRIFGVDAVVAAPETAPESVDDSQAVDAALALPPGEMREAALLLLAVESRSPALRLRSAKALTTPVAWASLEVSSQDKDRRVWKVARDHLADLRKRERAGVERLRLESALGELLERRPVDLPRLVEIDKRWQAILTYTEPGSFISLRHQVDARISKEQQAQSELRRILNATGELKARASAIGAGTEELIELDGRARSLIAELGGVTVEDTLPTQLRQATTALGELAVVLATATEVAQQRAQQAETDAAVLASTKIELTVAAPAATREQDREEQEKLRALIVRIETCVEAGSVAEAIALEGMLRGLREHGAALSSGWKLRLHAAVEQVAKLRGWQRAARDRQHGELIAAAEQLVVGESAAENLGAEIARLQAAWKKLDAHGGAAPKRMWERFQNATHLAYAQVKKQREEQSKARAANAELRRTLLVEAEVLGNTAPATAEDWKALPALRAALQKRWHAIGPVNRSQAKAMQAIYERHIKTIDAILKDAHAQEALRKQALITEVEVALAAARSALTTDNRAPPALLAAMRIAQDTQKRWTGERHALQSFHPAARREEQVLWDTYRNACSAIFALRDGKREQERSQQEQRAGEARATLEALENLAQGDDFAVMARRLGELEGSMRGNVLDPGVKRRLDVAVDKVRSRMAHLKQAAARESRQRLVNFDQALCQVEAARAAGIVDAPLLDAAAVMQSELQGILGKERALRDRATSALGTNRVDWIAQINQGEASRAMLMLDLEIVLGLESPPVLAQARRMRQLARLAEAMKNRTTAQTPQALLSSLLGTAGPPAINIDARMRAIVDALGTT